MNVPVQIVGKQDDEDTQLAMKYQMLLFAAEGFEHKKKEESEMIATIEGKAFTFVEKVLRIQNSSDSSSRVHSYFEAIVNDQLFSCVEAFCRKHQELLNNYQTLPFVDIGYHFTKWSNLDSIKKEGLLTRDQFEARGVDHINGSTFGSGIYTHNHPFAYSGRRGDIAVFTARLVGRPTTDHNDTTADTVKARPGFREVVMMRDSSQSLPLIAFPSFLLDKSNDGALGNRTVHDYHCQLQRVVDQLFNGSASTQVKRTLPSGAFGLPNTNRGSTTRTNRAQTGSVTASTVSMPTPVISVPVNAPSSQVRLLNLRYEAPNQIPVEKSVFCYVAVAQPLCSNQSQDETTCPVCWEKLSCSSDAIAALKKCGHLFHHECLVRALQTDQKCTSCRTYISEPHGTMPSASLIVTKKPNLTCPGHPTGSIELFYNIKAGTQKSFHPNPGQPYRHTSRTAFLPDTNDGRELLQRLCYAFQHGLTFTIGTSLTSGESDVVIWGSLHHKTSLVPDASHGYPDQEYFFRCHEELTLLGVPKANDCNIVP